MNSNVIRKNFLWNAFGNLIYLGLQWVITVLVTRWLGFDNAGIFSLAMSVSAIFQAVSLFGIRNFQVSDMKGCYADNSYILLRAYTCLLALLLCILFAVGSGYSLSVSSAVCGMMIFRTGECFADVFHGIDQKKERLDIAGKSFAIRGIVTILSFSVAVFMTHSVQWGIWAMALASVVITCFFDYPQAKKLADWEKFSNNEALKLAKITLPLCIYQFLNSGILSLPRYILEKQCDETALGIYASVYAPVVLLQAVSGYLFAPFVTSFTQSWQNNDKKQFFRLFGRICIAIAIMTVVAMLCAQVGEPVLILLFGEKIQEYSYLLSPAILCSAVASYLSFLGMLEIVVRDFVFLLTGCFLGVLTCCVVTPLWIAHSGLNGTSFGMMAGAGIASVIMVISLLLKIHKS